MRKSNKTSQTRKVFLQEEQKCRGGVVAFGTSNNDKVNKKLSKIERVPESHSGTSIEHVACCVRMFAQTCKYIQTYGHRVHKGVKLIHIYKYVYMFELSYIFINLYICMYVHMYVYVYVINHVKT